ncbi:MAG: PAS domain-containing sensor histidine kinase, partial [Epsilonproteobacteria bacterium]
EDILDFAKIESGKLNIDKVDFNAKSEFEVITHLFDAKCLQKNISLRLNIDDDLPQVINTDPLRIKQIISNLLSNAIKFTSEDKQITVNIEYNNNNLNISVEDQGIGVALDKQEHIFKAFSQEDSSTTRQYGGTGLGLSISSELVNLLGGELYLKSEVGIGSKFYFTIPITIGEAIKLKLNSNQKINFKNSKILLVEDNKANQMFMKVILKKMNLIFDIANDGIEAVNVYKINEYEAILMDENMPNLNGIGATKQIIDYEQQNNLSHTPIIALTANAIKGDKERFLMAGMDEYLSKPVDIEKLMDILSKFIGKNKVKNIIK